MFFIFKKVASSILLPLPIALILLLLGLVLLIIRKKSGISITLLCVGILVLMAFSTNPIASDLVIRLERQYQPLTIMPANVSYIVVLGGGNSGSRHLPPNTQLSSASLARLIEAIRLYHQRPHAILVLSGGLVFGSHAEATVMNNTAVALGIKPGDMIIERGSRDTNEEAQHLKLLIQDQPFVLVTSAYHMPRAMQIFKRYHMRPIAAPTQFLTKHYQYDPKYYFPSTSNLIHSDIAFHEYMGIAWFKLQSIFQRFIFPASIY